MGGMEVFHNHVIDGSKCCISLNSCSQRVFILLFMKILVLEEIIPVTGCIRVHGKDSAYSRDT